VYVECSRGLDRNWDVSSVAFPRHIQYYFEFICPLEVICLSILSYLSLYFGDELIKLKTKLYVIAFKNGGKRNVLISFCERQ